MDPGQGVNPKTGSPNRRQYMDPNWLFLVFRNSIQKCGAGSDPPCQFTYIIEVYLPKEKMPDCHSTAVLLGLVRL